MLIEIKRNSHIKIREKNRLLTYMHRPNFNEMLETKENILRLTSKSNTVIKKKKSEILPEEYN
jgi:hypothetical protein